MCLYFCFKEGKHRLGIPNISKMHLNKRPTSINFLARIKYIFFFLLELEFFSFPEFYFLFFFGLTTVQKFGVSTFYIYIYIFIYSARMHYIDQRKHFIKLQKIYMYF